jgi:hypothetical protein
MIYDRGEERLVTTVGHGRHQPTPKGLFDLWPRFRWLAQIIISERVKGGLFVKKKALAEKIMNIF